MANKTNLNNKISFRLNDYEMRALKILQKKLKIKKTSKIIRTLIQMAIMKVGEN